MVAVLREKREDRKSRRGSVSAERRRESCRGALGLRQGMGERDEVATNRGGRGGGHAEMEGGEGEGGSGGVVRWEGFLPRMPVKVLLVEGDDSTRQIITALLRKCGYRVAAVSDGLKAWEIVKESAHNIDLVLTEVELPVISGFVLLTMIMEHETCRHIPVIMMSSHDSISMVFKCMLKGAADFLVKPIRKNELTNLWQHVWRRHSVIGSHGGICCHDENPAERKLQANFGNSASNRSIEHAVCMQKYRDDSEKASDAQSSCTRSEMEAESTSMQNMKESAHPRFMDFSLMDKMITQNGEQSRSTLVMLEDDAEDESTMLGSEETPCNEVCNSNELIAEDNTGAGKLTMNEDALLKGHVGYNYMTSEANGQTPAQAKHEKEVIDLIGSTNNQLPYSHQLRDTTAVQNDLPGPAVFLSHKNTQLESRPIPLLELSLKRYHGATYHEKEKDKSSTLNHSISSAFSLYNNRTLLPTSSTPINSGDDCNAPDGATQPSNQEDAKLTDSPPFCQNGMEIQPPLRVVPFPVPIIWQTNGPVMQPIFYPPSGHSLWSAVPTMWQEAVQGNSSYQPDPRKAETVQRNHSDDQSTESSQNYPSKKHNENLKLVKEHWSISSAMDESGSSNILNGSRNHLNRKECGSFCFDGDGKTTAPDVSKTPNESRNAEDLLASVKFKETDFHHLSQREAALTKFRMKRKDRCYEKKVRYQSRKRLAEQRPRVKGQFVRQVQWSDSTNG